MSTAWDTTSVRRLFDPTTFVRGWSYASGGAVLAHSYDPAGGVVTGEVQGRCDDPYEVVVQLTRSASGAPSRVDGECTCPVGFNCKHVAALLLASGALIECSGPPHSSTAPSTGPSKTKAVHAERLAPATPRPPRWEAPLEDLIGALTTDSPAAEPGLGLHFELVAQKERVPQRARARNHPAVPGIRMRPVTRNGRGNWVRSGISWSRLEYRYADASGTEEQLRLFRELLAIHRLSGASGYYGYPSYGSSSYGSYGGRDVPVWLEDFSSRRVWDLLGYAEGLRIPLLFNNRHGRVELRRGPAVVSADLVAADDGVRMSAYLESDGEHVPLDAYLLVGRPANGLAWWRESQPGTQELVLAPLSRQLGRGEQAFLESKPVDVPARDLQRFLRDFYPRLARSVRVVSSNESLELPELPAAQLVLCVRHEHQRSIVTWQRGIDGSTWRDDLWPNPDPGMEHQVEKAVAAATEIVRLLPAMLDQTWLAERLASAAVLSGIDAVRFVTELLPALGEVPGLVIEEEGAAPEYRAAAAAPVLSLRSAGHGFDGDWFDLMVEVKVDDEDVVFQDLFVALSEGRSHLVLPSGTYFPLDNPALAELAVLIAEARAMQDRETGAPDKIRVSRYQAGLWEDLRDLGVLTAQATAWDSAVRALAEADDDTKADPPDDLDATLRPYQRAGFEWLAFLYRHRLGGILADDMGLGKTLQALSLICYARHQLGTEEPFLVVAPTSVVETWAGECARFAPALKVATVAETAARRWTSLSDLAAKADVLITSYTLFRLEYDDYERIAWAGLLLDEAQFIKNARSIAHQKARALPAPFKLAMTGTPIENNLKELWALLSITAPGLFPRSDRFTEHYAVPIERHDDTERLAQLRRRVRPLMLRRTKQQVAPELPDKQEQVLELELTPKHRRLYQTHLQRERQKILGLLGDMNKHRFEILRSLTLLRQAALDISLIDEHGKLVPSTKLDALMEMLTEIIADGHRVLVFSQFTRFLSTAAQRAAASGIEYCYLDGRTRRREQVIATFRAGKAPVFFISLKAGGFGLNLTEADYCILLDPWWNPATEAQAVDRTHRIGQTRKVMVYRLVSKDTIEEKVMALKAKKAALFANVMDGGGFESAALSASDIRSLLV